MHPQSLTDTLVLITASPQGASVTEDAFLSPELPLLQKRFKRIIRFALSDRPSALERIPYHMTSTALRAAWKAIRRNESTITANGMAANAVWWRNRFSCLIKSGVINPERTLFYTFWFEAATTGLALLCRQYPLRIISRAHGYDIRNERSQWLRDITFRHLLKLFPACETSSRQLADKWSRYADKIVTARLGSMAPKSIAPPPVTNNPIHIVSCARLHPVKRVDRIAKVVTALAVIASHRTIKWTHFGGGENGEWNKVRHALSTTDSRNIEVFMPGAVDNDIVHAYYAENAVHWNILLSDNEGGAPISLCEAMSHGIPVVATKVGGSREIVADGINGLATEPDSESPEQLARRIISATDNPECYASLRANARITWEQELDAAKLRLEFVNAICGSHL